MGDDSLISLAQNTLEAAQACRYPGLLILSPIGAPVPRV